MPSWRAVVLISLNWLELELDTSDSEVSEKTVWAKSYGVGCMTLGGKTNFCLTIKVNLISEDRL